MPEVIIINSQAKEKKNIYVHLMFWTALHAVASLEYNQN